MKQFEITYFHGPFPEYITRPEVIADIAAAGITLVPLSGDAETNKAALRLLSRYGLRAVVYDTRLGALYQTDDIAAADQTVREIVADYAGFSHIVGWDITDEPGASKFPILAAIVRAFRRYSPECETVINLFPNYASAQQLGNPDYNTHLEMFVNTVHPHFLSYDHYHFRGRENRKAIDAETTDERERLIRLAAEKHEDRAGFFENLESVCAVSQKYDLDAMLIVLLTEHGPYRNLTRAEILWEVNMCLAYGMKRLSYFTYWEPAYDAHWQWTNAMCDTAGKKMQHYYDVQSINREVRAVGAYLFDRRRTAVYHIGTPDAGGVPFAPCGGLSAVDGECGVLGCFDDGSFYLVNRDYVSSRSFTLHSDVPMTVWRDGVFVDLADRTVTLEAGAGILCRAVSQE